MAEQVIPTPPQTTDVPQTNNDASTVQPQDNETNGIPSTTTTDQLQPGENNLNNLQSRELQVTSGPVPNNRKVTNGTLVSIVLVAIILVAAAALFIASLRVNETGKEGKPEIAVGAEENGAQGTKKKKLFKKKSA